MHEKDRPIEKKDTIILYYSVKRSNSNVDIPFDDIILTFSLFHFRRHVVIFIYADDGCHNRMVPSSEPEAKVVPSGEYRKQRIGP